MYGGRLQGEEPDLRPVAVREHDVMPRGDLRHRAHRLRCMAALDVSGQRLAAAQQGVAAERDDEPLPRALASHLFVGHRPYPPIVRAMSALAVCMRFSASS